MARCSCLMYSEVEREGPGHANGARETEREAYHDALVSATTVFKRVARVCLLDSYSYSNDRAR
jgi:hypothetical protein